MAKYVLTCIEKFDPLTENMHETFQELFIPYLNLP